MLEPHQRLLHPRLVHSTQPRRKVQSLCKHLAEQLSGVLATAAHPQLCCLGPSPAAAPMNRGTGCERSDRGFKCCRFPWHCHRRLPSLFAAPVENYFPAKKLFQHRCAETGIHSKAGTRAHGLKEALTLIFPSKEAQHPPFTQKCRYPLSHCSPRV